MADPFREQKIQNWANEFAESDMVRAFPALLQIHAAEVAEVFLLAACRARDIEPDALTEADVKSGLFDGVRKLALADSMHGKAPDFCAAFLEMLQGQGRITGGRSLPSFVRALRPAFASRSALASQNARQKSPDTPKPKPIVRPGSKLGPNDPCPCGSGKKYKKCCKRLLG